MDLEKLSERALAAENNFKEGYNCAQAVVLAFSDIVNLDKETLLCMSSSFGGGMGRLREVCGSVSGMFMILGLLRGYSSPTARQEKKNLYAEIQSLAAEFKEINGSIVCRELLSGVPHTEGKVPEDRTPEYYQKRPCGQLVAISTQILENHLRDVGLIQ